MRPLSLRARGTAAALGALCATTTLAAAPAAQAAPAAHAGDRVTVRVADRTLSFGQRADLRGRARGVGAGGAVVVQQRPTGSRAWLTAGLGRTTAGGRFRVRAALRGAADVRVVAVPAAPARAAVAAVGAGLAISAPTHVRVVADVVVGRRRLDVRTGRRASVRGVVRPAVAGQAVALQHRTGRGWRTLDRGRTGAKGAFRLHARLGQALSATVRVRVDGAGPLAPAGEVVGRLNVFRPALVSWYGPGFYGQRLGCGGTLRAGQLGVANKSLPCGTMVTLRHGRRSVRVPVIDRGPYVGAREYDLTAATKDRLGFGGVGSVLVTR
jgi:hypothetical protein